MPVCIFPNTDVTMFLDTLLIPEKRTLTGEKPDTCSCHAGMMEAM